MKTTPTRSRNVSILTVVVAVAALGCAVVVPAGGAAEPAADPSRSAWAGTGDTASSSEIPTLTNDALTTQRDTGALLPLGFGLMALAALGLGYGIVSGMRNRGGGPPPRADLSAASTCPPADAVAAPL